MLSIFNKSLLIIISIYAGIPHSYAKTFKQCFAEKYNFTCGDPYTFFLDNGINIDHDILQLSDLQLYSKKPTGTCRGGIYHDTDQSTYYIKESNPLTELVGSKLINLIVGTQSTPKVKLVSDKAFTIASLELPQYQTQKTSNKTNKAILQETALAIAMDFIGLVDRNTKNMGYVTLNANTLLAARVDFDACFDFESTRLGQYSLTTDHLNLKQLLLSIQNYPKNEVIQAIQNIIYISDDQILLIIFQSWLTLSRAGYNLNFKACIDLAYQLIERKNAFRESLKLLNSTQYESIKQHPLSQKQAKTPQKHPNKKAHPKLTANRPQNII